RKATDGMNLKEKAIYRQVSHSILSDGLENFLIGKRKAPPTVRKAIYRIFAFPFKSKWMRWMMIWASVPHLNGKVIPWELAMKVAWEGQKAHQAELEPYLGTTLGKAAWNGFATVANRVMLAILLTGIPVIYFHHQEVKAQAIQYAKEQVTPE